MRIPDEQMDLFAKRLEAIGVGRREFLKVVGAMAAFGGLGFATTAQAAKPSKPGPNEKLAKEQTFASAAAAGTRTIRPATTSTRTSTAPECRPSSRA